MLDNRSRMLLVWHVVNSFFINISIFFDRLFDRFSFKIILCFIFSGVFGIQSMKLLRMCIMWHFNEGGLTLAQVILLFANCHFWVFVAHILILFCFKYVSDIFETATKIYCKLGPWTPMTPAAERQLSTICVSTGMKSVYIRLKCFFCGKK